MKKHYAAALTFIAVIGLLPVGNVLDAQSELFDQKKSRQEIEIMEGILETTLQFAIKEFRRQDESAKEEKLMRSELPGEIGRFSNIQAFYLYGQGAIFIIPTSGLQGRGFHYEVFETPALPDEAMKLLQPSPSPGSPKPSTSVTPQVAPGTAAGKPERDLPERNLQARKRLVEAQEKVKMRKETEAALQVKLDQLLVKIKGSMLEALANYGDSLTQVKPNEYITLIFTADSARYFKLMLAADAPPQQEIISVQKSVITDHKAGRLSLESFKGKVLNYKN